MALQFILSICKKVPSKIHRNPVLRLFQPTLHFTSANVHKFSTKRLLTRQENKDDISWSIVAYTLSERLMIEDSHKFMRDFNEYDIKQLPKDLQSEAVMLSLKPDSGASKLSSPIHDIFIFRQGSVVFWGVPLDQQKRILYGLSSLKEGAYPNDLIHEEREHLEYTIIDTLDKSRMVRDVVQLGTNQDKLLVYLDQFALSHAVALSVKLGMWESLLDQFIESIGWVTQSMKKGEDLNLTRSQIFRKTGEIYELKHRINLNSDLLDLPDVYWDRHDQEILFISLISFLNIKRRTSVINEKLNNCCELMNLLAGHMNDKHHVRLEWMIIILIMVEVLFEVAKHFT